MVRRRCVSVFLRWATARGMLPLALLTLPVPGSFAQDRAMEGLSPDGAGVQPVTAVPWRFVDRAESGGIDLIQRSGTATQDHIVEVKSTGAALLDLDGDGLLDIFFTQGSTLERQRAGEPGFGGRLYRNLGDWRFEDVTEAWKMPPLGWACGAAAADVNGDGRDDLLVTCYGPDRLLLNRGTHLEEVAQLGGQTWSASAAFADLDLDGDLDLYVTGYLVFDFQNPPRHGDPGWSCQFRGTPVVCGPRGFPAQADTAYEQGPDGRFEDATERWGLAVETPRYGLGVVIADLVGDYRPDIFVANDASANLLFAHRGDRFEEVAFWAGVAYSEDGEEQAGMGVDAIDMNGDGRLDLVVTNFEQEPANLYLSTPAGTFVDAADRHGVGGPSRATLSWGVGWRDFDNDGVLDLFVANGHVYPQAAQDSLSPGYAQHDQLYVGGMRADGLLRFDERGRDLGFPAAVSRGACFGDLDNDGDLDIVVCHLNARPGIYENQLPAGRHALVLSLQQPGANRQALGARVEVTAGSVHRVTEVRRQASFQASHDPRVHVGLGADAPAAAVRVRWPDGTWEDFSLPPGGGFHRILRGSGRPGAQPPGAQPPGAQPPGAPPEAKPPVGPAGPATPGAPPQ